MKNKSILIRNLLSTILALLAIGILFYPIVVNYMVAQQNLTTIKRYQEIAGKISPQKEHELMTAAKAYNDYIDDQSQGIKYPGKIPDYYETLSLDKSGMMGYISIPQIGVKNIPIYHGDSEQTLFTGVGHIPETSLPIGGRNTHAVLPAHSGRVNNTLFSELDKLKKGDVFYLDVLNLDLKYKVIESRVVDPKDVSTLNVIQGRDLVTLVTCYPTGINDKRLLVTGERVANNQKVPGEEINRNPFGYNFWVFLGSLALVGLALLSLLSMLLWRRRPLYAVASQKIERPELADALQNGAFGQGFYLTNSLKIARSWADDNEDDVINVYRLGKISDLTRWTFKYKNEGWQNYIAAAKEEGFSDPAHELLAGPIEDVKGRSLQYCLKSSKGLDRLRYLKTLEQKGGNHES